MNIYQLKVPIPNYYGDGIYEQEMYYRNDVCPTANQWHAFAEENHERDRQFPEYTGDWLNVMKAIENAVIEGQFPMLYGNCVMTNGFVSTRFGKKPISVQRLFVKGESK